jgi:hypothetical protein
MNKSSVIFPVSLLLCAFFISGIMAVTNASAQPISREWQKGSAPGWRSC